MPSTNRFATLFLLHVAVIFIFLSLFCFAIYQYVSYKTFTGTMLCNQKMDQCLLSAKIPGQEEMIEKIYPFNAFGKGGLYQLTLVKSPSDDIIILGTNTNVFFGTFFRIMFYGILSLFSVISLFVLQRQTMVKPKL